MESIHDDKDSNVIELNNITKCDIIVNNKVFDTSIKLIDLIRANKYLNINENNFINLPKTPGNYWILTNEPIKHSFNPHFNDRPKPFLYNKINYNIIYNGIAQNIQSRIISHLNRIEPKGSGDMSGISLDILHRKYKSHNKLLWKSQKNAKKPYYEEKKKPVEYDDLSDFYSQEDTEDVKNFCKTISVDTNVYFKNGIDIKENKHSKYSWIVIYYDMNDYTYTRIGHIIESEWRKNNGYPMLGSYKSGR